MPLDIGSDMLGRIGDIARRAGDAILKVYETDFDVETKSDRSPVTAADEAAEALITRALLDEVTDAWPIVGEEAASAGKVPDVAGKPFWLVDPLDGTKEFISRNGEFTVNIALIDAGQPVLGVVHVPALGTTYLGSADGAFIEDGSGPRRIRCRPVPATGLIALVSRSHRTPEIDGYLERFDIADEISAGSSLKFCRVAEGAADIYPRLGRTMEWDTAAAHAVLRFAGGRVTTLDGNDLTYGKPGFENPHFVAFGAGALPDAA